MSKLSLDELSDLGVAYLDARGRPKKSIGHGPNGKAERFKSGSQSQFVGEMPSSAQVLTFSAVADVVARSEKMDITLRRAHICEKKLCFNCLKFRHHVFACRSSKRCDQCGKKTTAFFIRIKQQQKLRKEEVHQADLIATTVKSHGTPPPALLMTSVAEVKSLSPVRVRIFFDPGVQVLFVSSSLVNVLQDPKVGTEKLSLKGFGSFAVFSETAAHSFTLIGVDADEFDFRALERQKLYQHSQSAGRGCTVVGKSSNRGQRFSRRLEPVCDPILLA